MSEKSSSGSMPWLNRVHAERHQAHVAGALAVAEQAALDAVRAGQVAQLGGRHGGPAVVVRVQRQHHVLAVAQVPAHPLDRVGVDVRRGHLDRRRQVDDDLLVRRRAQLVEHRVADPQRELQLGARVRLGAVLVEHLGVRHQLLVLLAEPRPGDGDVDDPVLVGTEHDLALERGRRVVQVHDGLLGAGDRLVRPLDQVLAGLRQHLDHDVVRDAVLLDQHPDEVEVRLGRRREADLDLLEPHLDQQLEHLELAGRVHRLDQGLVAVPQVDGAPARGLRHPRVGPPAVRQVDADLLVERPVLVDRHRRRLLRARVEIAHRVLVLRCGIGGLSRRTEHRDEDAA
ncbi:hypothetical protein ACVW07_000754 [Cellulomonas sp. URHB0016]